MKKSNSEQLTQSYSQINFWKRFMQNSQQIFHGLHLVILREVRVEYPVQRAVNTCAQSRCALCHEQFELSSTISRLRMEQYWYNFERSISRTMGKKKCDAWEQVCTCAQAERVALCVHFDCPISYLTQLRINRL